MGILVLEVFEKVVFNRNLASICYFEACFFCIFITFFTCITIVYVFCFLVCCVFVGKFDRLVSDSDMSAKRQRFDVGKMMKARKGRQTFEQKNRHRESSYC